MVKKDKNTLSIRRPDLLKEWDYEKNDLICSPDNVTIGSNKKVWWKCVKGHSWEATINNRNNGSGCPFCSGKKTIKGINDFASKNSFLLSEWDYDKNASICKPSDVSSGSHTTVWWKCEKGHSWKAPIRDRVNGSLCPVCSGKKILKGFNDLQTKHPELMVEWNFAKNTVTPDSVGIGSHTKVWWRCSVCGNEWKAEISNRVSGSGCPMCGLKKRTIRNKTAKYSNSVSFLHPELLTEWDYDANKDLSPDTVNVGSTQKIWWICKDCGSHYCSTVSNRTRGAGCPVCAGKRIEKGINDLESWCNKNGKNYILEEWDYEKNSLLPTEIAPFSNKKIWFLCREGHSYSSNIANKIVNHTGCPICEKSRRTSFQEQACFYYVEHYFPDAINSFQDKWLGKLELDVFVPSQKVGIEYDGEKWHKDTEKDLNKNLLCKKNDIRLIRVREKNLPELYECETIIVEDRSAKALNTAILCLLRKLNINKPDINVDRDSPKIIERFDFKKKENSILDKYPDLINEWDYEKNGKINPEYVNYGSTRKFWWKCQNCGNSFLMAVNNRTNQGQGCPICSKAKRGKTRIKSLISRRGSLVSNKPDLMEEWDYEKNTISPEDLSVGSKQKVWWKCQTCGGSWLAEIQNRSKEKGTGCPYCSGRKVLKGFNDLSTTHPELLDEWDASKNDGLEPVDFTEGSSVKINWTCKKCGKEWKASIDDRAKGKGCPYCSGRKVLKGFNDVASTNPELIEEWDFEKNESMGLSPGSFSYGSHEKVWWKCKKCGHQWIASIGNRSKGQGCPVCSKERIAKNQKRRVKCIENGVVFESVSEAANWAKVAPGAIVNNLKGKTRSSKGLHWEYVTEDE